jgi:hypothetical protein
MSKKKKPATVHDRSPAPRFVTFAVTEVEQAALVILLKELRRSKKLGQISITIDPWTSPGLDGYTIFAAPNAEGRIYEVGQQPEKRR